MKPVLSQVQAPTGQHEHVNAYEMLAQHTLALPALGQGEGRTEAPDIERKLVTVLFIDVKNSMGLSREMQLEEWWSVSVGLFRLMCESVERFGGWVGSFTGDGVNGVFENARKPAHHARQACLAALWLRDAIRGPAAELQSIHGLELSVRIGINSGEVLTGTISHRRSRFHTANGYAVALAQRMEALAPPYQIYLTEYTAAFVTHTFHLRDLGAVRVKGAGASVGVFELVGSVRRR
jgi:class 3 adenylate cyclase